MSFHGRMCILTNDASLQLNNERVYTPVQNRLQGISIGNVGRFIVVETDFGVIVKYDGNHHLEITLPRSYFSQVRFSVQTSGVVSRALLCAFTSSSFYSCVSLLHLSLYCNI